ncbi:MAG: peptidylprolyl isomerase [Deltaproteobacteria bacterium]|nr:peptidylprolyl isomerase [Deltaproteobacteria bacterium]MBI4796152.1 peptidylprolyl isomerase [Deltaproteobacteria bacterium]
MAKVKNGDYVQVHYTGALENGDVFDSSDGRGPLEFQAGGGMVIPGFNDAVMDMEIHEEKQVVLNPDQAYGERRDDMEREFSTEMLGGQKVEVGQMLQFSSPRGPMPGQVLEVTEDKFKVDFNHPLAGKTLVFTIKLAGISDQPTQQACGCGCSSTDCGTSCG